MTAPEEDLTPVARSVAPTLRGLSSREAQVLLERYGPNELPRPRQTPVWRQLLAQLTHFFAVLLWVAAGLALLAGMQSLAVAIAVIVLLNGVFAFVQEHRADRAAERLGALMPSAAHVRRDGGVTTLPIPEIVPGDVVLLTAGDRVPADLRVLVSNELALDEAMLTGESVPVHAPPSRAAYAGTFVVLGEGEAEVTATGTHTRLAEMASLTEQATRPPSPLERELDHLVRLIAVIAVATGTVLAGVALLLGSAAAAALLFGVGVTVALVPEGLLPTVTLSLARGAQRMARDQALVRHLEAVETLGATTFICTDKTGTLTRNEMAVVEVWTPAGSVLPHGVGYEPSGTVAGSEPAVVLAAEAAAGARACVTGRAVQHDEEWIAEGDPMEAAVDVLASRLGRPDITPAARVVFSSERMYSAAALAGTAYVLGAPEILMARCSGDLATARVALDEFADSGRRVLAVTRTMMAPPGGSSTEDLATRAAGELRLLALLAIEDPPRDGVREALQACRTAGIRVAMMTGDNARTAAAIAHEVGLLGPGGVAIDGAALPDDEEAVAALLDNADGAVVARVTPADKLRVATALRRHGHVVAMTGDGVNDAAALRGSDLGVAMGRTGSDVARQAADLVLLDDHFATIVRAIELGRSTYANIRRFLTYHLTDNVAELAPFALWALTGGAVPAAIGVLQVLALDIGTDMLPALALGNEPASNSTMKGPRRHRVADGSVLRRAFLVLGPVEAAVSLAAFWSVLHQGGWRLGQTPRPDLLATASGTTFAVIAMCQVANAFACRSETRPAWRLNPLRNPLLLWAVVIELALLALFVGLPAAADLLGGSWPPAAGWACAAAGAAVLLLADAVQKRVLRARRR